jgi:hypothetical protein
LHEPKYRQNAQRFRAAIQRAGGVLRAADIVESRLVSSVDAAKLPLGHDHA